MIYKRRDNQIFKGLCCMNQYFIILLDKILVFVPILESDYYMLHKSFPYLISL